MHLMRLNETKKKKEEEMQQELPGDADAVYTVVLAVDTQEPE